MGYTPSKYLVATFGDSCFSILLFNFNFNLCTLGVVSNLQPWQKLLTHLFCKPTFYFCVFYSLPLIIALNIVKNNSLFVLFIKINFVPLL